jgi:hypothetical protein
MDLGASVAGGPFASDALGCPVVPFDASRCSAMARASIAPGFFALGGGGGGGSATTGSDPFSFVLWIAGINVGTARCSA